MKLILDFLRKDVWRKLIALTIAFVLYLNLYEQKEREIHDVTVEIQHDPEIFIAPADNNRPVRLTVRGSKQQVDELAMQGNLSGRVMLKDGTRALRTGNAVIRLTPEMFNCDGGIEIIRIEPEVFKIPVQRQISRTISISPDLSGTPAPGKIAVKPLTCVPDTVTVTGPEKSVSTISSIRTEKLSIEGESLDFEKELKLINPNPDILTLSHAEAKVTVTIKDSTDIQRKIHDIPVRYMLNPLHLDSENYSTLPEPAKVTVVLRGNQLDLGRISRDTLVVFADLSDKVRPGKYTVPLKAVLDNSTPDSVKIFAVEPDSATVTITGKKNKK